MPNEIVKLQDVRLSFFDGFVPRAQTGDDGKAGTPKYSSTFLFPKNHPAVAAINAAIEKVAKEKWGEKAPAILKSLRANGKVCLRDGATKSEYEGFDGNFFTAASSIKRPRIVARDNSPLTQNDGKPYSGCFVNGSIEVWAQDNKFGKRVNAGLRGVQFLRDGDSFGGGGAPVGEDEFDALEGSDAPAMDDDCPI